MRIVELQTRPLTEAAPTPNTIGKEKDTIIAQQVSATEVELYVTDDRGKVLKARIGSASGGGGGTTPTIKDVLTAGNELEGKEIVGDLNVISESPINPSEYYNLSATKDGYILESKSDTRNYSSMLQIGTAAGAIRHDFHYPVSRGISSGYLDLGANGINLKSETTGHEEGFQFKANSDGLIYEGYIDGEGVTYLFNKNGITWYMPNLVDGGILSLNYTNSEGLFGTKYFTPTREEHYVQKKYVDGLLGGGKPEVTIDNMYLTYGGKLALHVTIENMDSTTINSPEPHKYSVLHMFTTSPGSGNMAELFNLNGSDSRVSNIQQVYKDVDSGTYKFRFEINPSPLVSWFAATKNENLFTTKGQFDYINDSQGTIRVKSRPTYYGELYRKDQAGVISFVPKGGSLVKGEIIPTSSEIDYFRTNQNVFETESVFRVSGNDYNLELAGGGAPLGSLDMGTFIEPFTTDGKIMSNPTPGQVTDWELTIGLSGNNIDAIDTQNYAAVICDADDNVLDSKPIFPFTEGFVPAHPHDIKVTLRTINTFKNIIGNGKGFKLGIRTTVASSSLDTKFELKSFKRISHSLA